MAEGAKLFRGESRKEVTQFVADLQAAGQKRGFLIHNEDKMAMAHTFGAHGVEVATGFDLHMIQICNPAKAADSLQKNPERAALMPKFVTVFTAEGITKVRFLRYSTEMILTLIDDADFAASVSASYDAIEAMITEAL